jgi:colanic acid/amylovoran biosynthesis glycosyltransferase
MAQKILEAGCPASKIKIQHLGVCPEIYQNLELAKEKDKIVILFCGRFTEKKGIRYALEAFSRIVHKYSQLEMKLVGSGEDDETISEKIRELKIEGKVKLMGVLPFKELVKELRNADIFIHPSVTASDGDSEGGAPTILMEASAAGLPIVSTRHADIPEVVLHGQTGFLAEERNVEQLIHSLEVLINDPLLRKTMGDQGRQHIIENYNIENEASKLEDFYLSILQSA